MCACVYVSVKMCVCACAHASIGDRSGPSTQHSHREYLRVATGQEEESGRGEQRRARDARRQVGERDVWQELGFRRYFHGLSVHLTRK